MHFSDEFIAELLEQIDLTEVMEIHGVETRRGQGKNDFYVAWCCNKSDLDNGRITKDNIYKGRRRPLYQCKSCQKGGSAINFVRDYAGKSFRDAVIWLANHAKMELPNEFKDPQRQAWENRKAHALREAVAFYQSKQHDYFLNRGISRDVLKAMGAGYAPGGRALRSHMEAIGFTKEELIDFRLVNPANGHDSFFYRAIFPIYMNGRIVDIYGRAVDDKKSNVRHFYLYGDDILHGIDRVDPQRVVKLFEGHTDMAVAESFGIANGVTPGGAGKFSEFHARLLKKKGVERVAILYDGDKAGQKGALEAGELLEAVGIQVTVVELPEGQDVAKLLNDGGLDKLNTYSRQSKPFRKFKAFCLMREMPLEYIQDYLNEQQKGAVLL